MDFTDTPSSSFPPQREGSARCEKCFSCASELKAEQKEQNVQARQALGITVGLNQIPSSKLTVHGPLATATTVPQETARWEEAVLTQCQTR